MIFIIDISDLVHTMSEEFENGGFTLKALFSKWFLSTLCANLVPRASSLAREKALGTRLGGFKFLWFL